MKDFDFCQCHECEAGLHGAKEVRAEVERLEARVKELEAVAMHSEAEIQQRGEDIKTLEETNDRLMKDRREILNVKTTDGLTSSEWLLRTANAKADRDHHKERAEQYRRLVDVLLQDCCTCGGAGPGEGCPACEVWHELKAREGD